MSTIASGHPFRRPLVKFCGLTRTSDADAVNRVRPDFVGFVFAGNGPRRITFEKARAIKERLIDSIATVGVFDGEEPATILSLVREGLINAVQLHGTESARYVRDLVWAIRSRGRRTPVIQAFTIHTEGDAMRAGASPADLVLLDAGAGLGRPFDWNLIKDFKRSFILAGGLSAENVADALRRTRPIGLDVSSGIKTDGLNDIRKMKAFMAAIEKEDPQ